VLRLFYVAYFTAVAVSLPFFPPYLRGLGLTGRKVSWVLALAPVCHLGVPLFWGWLADRTRRPDLALRIAAAGAALLFVPLIGVRAMPAILLLYGVHQAFNVAIPGLLDSLAIERVRKLGEDYGRIRVWGSVSFTAMCLALGPLLTARGSKPGDALVPILMVATLGLAFLTSLGVRGMGAAERPHASDIRALVRDPRFVLLLVVANLHWACTAPYHAFFSILLQDRGLSPQVMSNAFVVSVLGEMAAFFFFSKIRRRFALSTVLAWAVGSSILRWIVVARSGSPAVLVLVQVIHMLTFGAFHAAAVAWLAECVPAKLRATGQTLYTASVYGLGNLLGMLGSGALYDATGGAATSFLVAGVLELLPLALVLGPGRRLDPTPVTTPARP
jgi:PPP family 3-phenylpropionic acid transporter